MQEITIDILKNHGFAYLRNGDSILWFRPSKSRHSTCPYFEVYMDFDYKEYSIINGEDVYIGVRNFVNINGLKCYTLDALKSAILATYRLELKTEYRID